MEIYKKFKLNDGEILSERYASIAIAEIETVAYLVSITQTSETWTAGSVLLCYKSKQATTLLVVLILHCMGF